MHSSVKRSFLILAALIIPASVFAASGDLFLQDSVRFSAETFIEGQTIRIYASVGNNGTDDERGVVRFAIDGKQIQGDQPVSVIAEKEDAVFVDWIVAPGNHQLSITVIPFDSAADDAANNSLQKNIVGLADADRDAVPNIRDSDDDNDGFADENDAFPLNKNEQIDSDADGIGNNADPDDDNDGVPDTEDAFPLDSTESVDSDGDGVGNNADDDDDNDGIPDTNEISQGTNPLTADTDKDGVVDNKDLWPSDAAQTLDYDSDGKSDEQDNDGDNDGIPKKVDVNDMNKGPKIILKSLNTIFRKFTFPGQKIQFSTEESSDEDGEIQKVAWKVPTGSALQTSAPTIELQFDRPGKKRVAVIVTDDKGESREEEVSLLVLPRWLPFVGSLGFALLITLAIQFVFSYSKRRYENRHSS